MYRGIVSRLTRGRVMAVWMRGLSSLDDFLLHTVKHSERRRLLFFFSFVDRWIHTSSTIASIGLWLQQYYCCSSGVDIWDRNTLWHIRPSEGQLNTQTQRNVDYSNYSNLITIKYFKTSCGTSLQLGWSLCVAADSEHLKGGWGQQERPGWRWPNISHQ